MARNIEVLRNYFLGKDPQLKETMADNSLRLIGIEGKHFVLRTELIARLEDLKGAVDAEDEELQSQIDSLIRDLSAETLARSNKDTQLETKIDNEILQRQNADYGLQILINHNLNRIVDLETWKRNTDFVLEDDLEEALENYYTKPEIIGLISGIPKFSIKVVQTLPIQDISETTIYLVPSQDPDTGNSYEEYIYVNQNWELIGTTRVDLSDYYTKEEIDDMVEDYEDKSNKTQTISEESTNQQYPSASAVYNVSQEVLQQANEEAEEKYERLLAQIPVDTVEGDLITIDDSSDLPFKDVKLYGNTKQVQSTGKNLADTTPNGWSRGSYGTDGTATTNQYWARSVNMIPCLGGQSFTLSTQVACAGLRLYEYDALGTYIKYSQEFNATSVSITADGNTRFLHWCVAYRNTSSGDYGSVTMSQARLDSLGLMLNTGLTALPFEPYTNGAVEPNPDNPRPIEVVKGDVTIKKTRKNLLKPSVPASASIVTLDDDTWVINGTTTVKQYYFSASQTIKVKANVPYTFTLIPVENMESDRVQCSIVGNPEVLYGQFAGDTDRYTYTFVFPKDMEIAVRLYNDRGTEGVERSFDMKFKFQIEEGDTATEYEKYEEDVNVVPLGTVNLFNKETADVKSWLINNSTHVITVSSQEKSVIVQVKPNTTYTISKMQTSRFRVGEYPTMPVVGDTLNNYKSDGGTVITTTTLATTNYMVIHFINTTSYDLQEALDSLQIEEGSIAHGYSPYGLEPTELCKIGEHQDYIYKENGKWYKYGAIGKYTFTGEETWTASSYGTNSWACGSAITHFNDDYNTIIISNIFRGCSYADRATAGDNIIFGSGATNIFIRNTSLTTLQDVQNATAGNIIYYVLRNPVITEITDTNLIAKLDELLDSTTFKNYTNIEVTAPEQVPTLEAIYRKDLETLINNSGGGGSISIATTIDSTSTNDEAAGAKAVYDFAPKITYGTEELTPGVSELAEGTFYFQYE